MNNHATVQSSAPVSAAPLLQVSGALIAIIALILAAAWLVKRLGFAPKRTGVNGLKISASASLGARERVVVVDVEDARLVLGVTAGQINLLHKLPPSAPTEEIPQTDFQSVMKNLLKRSGRSIPILVFITLAACASAGYSYWHSHQVAADDKAQQRVVPSPVFYALDTFTVNLGDADRVLYIGITLRLKDEATRSRLSEYLPEVRSRLLLLFSRQDAAVLATEEGKKNLIAEIKTTLSTPLVAGQPKQDVTDVLYTAFILR